MMRDELQAVLKEMRKPVPTFDIAELREKFIVINGELYRKYRNGTKLAGCVKPNRNYRQVDFKGKAYTDYQIIAYLQLAANQGLA